MSVIEMIPTMADDALSNLRANAARLERAGSSAQRAQAAQLLPVIEAELASRRQAKLERTAQKRKARTTAAQAAAAQTAAASA